MAPRRFAREWWWVGEVEVETAGGAGLGASTPHLASPLEGGRDELGKGVGWVVVGSCLRRNDGSVFVRV